MVTSTIYNPSTLQSTKVAISQDELREILTQIESEFCQSEIYQRAVGGLQKRLDQASVNVPLLIQAVGREAIRLALRQVVQQSRSENNETFSQPQKPQAAMSGSSEEEPAASREFASESPSAVSATDSAERSRSTHSRRKSGQTQRQNELQLELNPKNTASQSKDATVPLNSVMTEAAASCETSKSEMPRPTNSQRPSAHPTDSQADGAQSAPRSAVRVSSRLTHRSKGEQSPNQTARSEALQQIGQRLQQGRLQKSWSVHDIHQQTRVPLHQIQSLELGEIDHLPEDIYVRGFIRRVAEVLDLDSAALLELLPQPFNEANLLPTWHGPAQTTQGSDLKTKTLKNQRHLRPLHLYLGYAALMTGAAGGLTWISQQPIDGLNVESFSLEALPDVPEFIQNLAPIQVFKQEMQNLSQRSQTNRQGAIAQPETIPVESSAPSGY